MAVLIVILVAIVGRATAFEINDEEYHQMPPLYRLDDWEGCLARGGSFCLASFELLPGENDQLFEKIQRFSSNKYHFNHTHIHRGHCLQASCAHIQEPSPKRRFERCVEEATRRAYGLSTNLTRLQYCRTAATPQPGADRWDMLLVSTAALILLVNVLGTAYDVLRKGDGKANPYLMAWSVRKSWQRLTAVYSDGDKRLSALMPLHGMKAISLLCVMLAHSVMAFHFTYLHNPQFLEQTSHHFLAAYFQNGTSLVQTFIIISCFLLAYNLLLSAEKPGHQLSIRMLPACLLHRIVRVLPAYMAVVLAGGARSLAAGGGPLRRLLLGGEVAGCRRKWWTHALFLNNMIDPDVRCLIQTWFIPVDMQLYVACALLVLVVPGSARRGVLCALLAAAVLANFAIIHSWQLKPMVLLMFPEVIKNQFANERSFEWLYTAPWDSLPAALIGVLVASVQYDQQRQGYKPADSLCIRVLYRLSVPAMFLWVVSGYWMKSVSHPLLVSLYASLDRPIFASLTAFAMYGFINKIDSAWWQLLSWRAWEILDRMSLSVFLVHWLIALNTLALRTTTSTASVIEIGGHWFTTTFLTYWTALPLHLLLELPAQRFLQTVFK